MVNLPGSFDPNNGDVPEPRGNDFGMLPPGSYVVQMIEADRTETDENDPNFTLKTTFEILEGQYKSRRLWHYFKLMGNHEIVQKIANDQLRAVCHAVKVLSPNPQSEWLLGKPMKVNVKAIPAGTVRTSKAGKSYTYEKDTNEITGFGPADQQGGTQYRPQQPPQAPQGSYHAPQQSQPQAPARPAGNVPPWQRKSDGAPPF